MCDMLPTACSAFTVHQLIQDIMPILMNVPLDESRSSVLKLLIDREEHRLNAENELIGPLSRSPSTHV